MEKGLAVFQGYGCEHDTIVARAERPLTGVQYDLQVVRRLRGDAIGKGHAIGIIQGLIILLADADIEDIPLPGIRCAAILGIEVKHQRVTPIARLTQGCAHRCKRVVDQRVDGSRHTALRFAGFQVERAAERVVAKSISQYVVFCEQRSGGTHLCSGSRDAVYARTQQQQRTHAQRCPPVGCGSGCPSDRRDRHDSRATTTSKPTAGPPLLSGDP